MRMNIVHRNARLTLAVMAAFVALVPVVLHAAGRIPSVKAAKVTMWYTEDGKFRTDKDGMYLLDRLSDGRFIVDSVNVEGWTPVELSEGRAGRLSEKRARVWCEALAQRAGFENARFTAVVCGEDWETLQRHLRWSEDAAVAAVRDRMMTVFAEERNYERLKAALEEVDPAAWRALLDESREDCRRVVVTAWYREVASDGR